MADLGDGFDEQLIGSIRRMRGPFRRLGRNTSPLDLANLCSLLQWHQNALVAGQRCTGLSSVPESSTHTRSLPDFITITCGFRFSVRTVQIASDASFVWPCRRTDRV